MGLLSHHRQYFVENAFTTIQPDAGTSVVADNTTDTLTLTSSDASITVTGNSDTDTIDFTLATISIANGGTGQTTQTEAFDALSPLTTIGDMLYHDGSDNVRLAGNATNSQLFLASTGASGAALAPSWQPIPALGVLSYYFTDTASDVATYFKQLPTNFTGTATNVSLGVVDAELLATYITEPGNPNRTFIPDGQYSVHIHAAKTAGTKTAQIYAEIWETNASGVDIAKITTLGTSIVLTGVSAEYLIATSLSSNYVLTDTNSRIATKVYATITGGGSAPDITIYMSPTADSHTNLPAPIIDITNYVPYTGATSNLDLGTFDLNADNFADLTTAGDILYNNGTDVVRLPVGADNEVLTVDTALAGKINWEAAGGGGLSITGTDNRIVRMDLTTGIQDSGVTLDDSDNITGVVNFTMTGAGEISNPQGNATNESFGNIAAIGSSGKNVAMGSGANAGGGTGFDNVAIGYLASAGSGSTSNGVAVGRSAFAGQSGTAIGEQAICWSGDSVAIGTSADSGNRTVGIGAKVAVNAANAVVIGYNNAGGTGACAVGQGASATGSGGSAYGKAADSSGATTTIIGNTIIGGTSANSTMLGATIDSNNFDEVLLLGQGASAGAANQCVIGSGTAVHSDWFIGAGIASTVAFDMTMSLSEVSGTNASGADWIFKTGVGTGTGSSEFQWWTVPAGATGATANTQTLRMKLTSDGHLVKSGEAGIAASATQTQAGGTVLTKDINEVATVTTTNDAITMPTAQAFMEIFIINNGANTLQLFPAVSDNLGAGVDTAVTLAAGANITYVSYDATNWEIK